MRRALTLILALLAVDAAAAAPTAFFNVNVIPMTDERVLPAQTVMVEDGVITVIGPVDAVPLPGDARIIDGTDRYLIPGLAEMHAHVPGDEDDLDRVLTLFAANGVTTIRGMLGRPSHLALRQQLLDGERFGPRLITSGPSLNGNSVSGPADGERQVRDQHSAGYDFLKIHPGLTAAEYRAIANTANELGMPFAGHVPVPVGLDGVFAAGMATIDHLDGYLESTPYFNALIGRYGNRIGKGKFTLDGVTYTLATNDGENHLHGGLKGFDKVVWDAVAMETVEGPALTLLYVSADGEEGFVAELFEIPGEGDEENPPNGNQDTKPDIIPRDIPQSAHQPEDDGGEGVLEEVLGKTDHRRGDDVHHHDQDPDDHHDGHDDEPDVKGDRKKDQQAFLGKCHG